jgi:pyrroline-5-carboxylate reductase
MRLARQTVIGSAALAENDPETPISKLRENVTSPGGITEAALNVLMGGEVQKSFDKAIEAAIKRNRELGK